jgi:7-cyano-7-deazaguanine reductase
MPSLPTTELAVFPNPAPGRDYLVHIECPEFTCLCPLTGQPDFATLVLDYIPGKVNLELKALKLYLWSFRDRGVFHEAVTNEIVDQMVARLKPRFLRLTAKWYVRGGLFTTVVVEHRKQGWKPAPGAPLGTGPASSDGASVRG